jgi:tRNA(fMet)-specific endonuclease VapC
VTLRFLLDTTIVSSPIANQPSRRVLKRLEQHSFQCAIGAPVWHELVYGCGRLPTGKRRTALQEYLQEVVQRSFPILPYDEVAATWHARERARLEHSGKTPPFVDGQIAAIAHSKDLTLVTANAKHFEWFEDLDVTDWTR